LTVKKAAAQTAVNLKAVNRIENGPPIAVADGRE
jgi:hypothetical protein